MATGRVPTTANSPLTAKGDLFGYSTTQARVAVGNNGETLVADSSTSTGLRYTAGTVQANPIINSAMQVWQRGTSSAIGATGSYIPDRWIAARTGGAAGGTVSRQTTGDTTNLPNIQYCARVQRDSGNTSTSNISLSQVFETVNSIPYAGKTVTISFFGRKGADYSSASSALPFRLNTGTGTDQNPITTGYTGSANPVTSTATLTATWQRFSATGTIAATATEMSFISSFDPVGTAGAADYYEITGVQIDIGSVALPFRTYAATIQGELAACQRYYYRAVSGAAYSQFAIGSANTSTVCPIQFTMPVPMRVAPTSVDFSTLRLWDAQGASQAITGVSLNTFFNNPIAVILDTTVASGLTASKFYFVSGNNSTSAYLAVNAEL